MVDDHDLDEGSEMISIAEADRRAQRVAASARKQTTAEWQRKTDPERLHALQDENRRLQQDLEIERQLGAAGLSDASAAWRSRVRELAAETPEGDIRDLVDIVIHEREAEQERMSASRGPVSIGSVGSPPAEPALDPGAELAQVAADMTSSDPIKADAAYRRAKVLRGGR